MSETDILKEKLKKNLEKYELFVTFVGRTLEKVSMKVEKEVESERDDILNFLQEGLSDSASELRRLKEKFHDERQSAFKSRASGKLKKTRMKTLEEEEEDGESEDEASSPQDDTDVFSDDDEEDEDEPEEPLSPQFSVSPFAMNVKDFSRKMKTYEEKYQKIQTFYAEKKSLLEQQGDQDKMIKITEEDVLECNDTLEDLSSFITQIMDVDVLMERRSKKRERLVRSLSQKHQQIVQRKVDFLEKLSKFWKLEYKDLENKHEQLKKEYKGLDNKHGSLLKDLKFI